MRFILKNTSLIKACGYSVLLLKKKKNLQKLQLESVFEDLVLNMVNVVVLNHQKLVFEEVISIVFSCDLNCQHFYQVCWTFKTKAALANQRLG